MSTPSAVDRLRASWRLLVKELSGFGVVGIVAFAIDLGIFQVLYAHAGTGAVTAQLCSTLVSMTVAYVGHRFWSFAHRARTGLRREYLVFAIVNGITLAFSLLLVWFVAHPLGQDSSLVLQLTKIVGIAVGTVVRYLAYRKWVFVAEDHPAAVAHAERVSERAEELDPA